MNGNERNGTATDLDAILRQLSNDQIRFVIARVNLSTDKEAAREAQVSASTVKHWKSDAPIDEAVRLMIHDGMVTALELRRRALAKAMSIKVLGLDSKDEKTRQSVATEIIEWEMGKAMQRNELSGKDGPIRLEVVWDEGPPPDAA